MLPPRDRAFDEREPLVDGEPASLEPGVHLLRRDQVPVVAEVVGHGLHHRAVERALVGVEKAQARETGAQLRFEPGPIAEEPRRQAHVGPVVRAAVDHEDGSIRRQAHPPPPLAYLPSATVVAAVAARGKESAVADGRPATARLKKESSSANRSSVASRRWG